MFWNLSIYPLLQTKPCLEAQNTQLGSQVIVGTLCNLPRPPGWPCLRWAATFSQASTAWSLHLIKDLAPPSGQMRVMLCFWCRSFLFYFLNTFIQSTLFCKDLLSITSMPGPVLVIGKRAVNKQSLFPSGRRCQQPIKQINICQGVL